MVVSMHQVLGTRRALGVALGLILLQLAAAAAVRAAKPYPPSATAQARRRHGAGLPTPPRSIGAIGRFIDQSITNVGAGVKGAGETLGGATSAAGDLAKGVTDAAGTVARLPLSNVVSGSERCVIAPNGAPDCAAASVTLCRTKGFARGSSLDISSRAQVPGVGLAARAHAIRRRVRQQVVRHPRDLPRVRSRAGQRLHEGAIEAHSGRRCPVRLRAQPQSTPADHLREIARRAWDGGRSRSRDSGS